MKIVCVDNYDRETVSDVVVATGLDRATAFKRAEEMNLDEKRDPAHYYQAREDDHKDYTFQP